MFMLSWKRVWQCVDSPGSQQLIIVFSRTFLSFLCFLYSTDSRNSIKKSLTTKRISLVSFTVRNSQKYNSCRLVNLQTLGIAALQSFVNVFEVSVDTHFLVETLENLRGDHLKTYFLQLIFCSPLKSGFKLEAELLTATFRFNIQK